MIVTSDSVDLFWASFIIFVAVHLTASIKKNRYLTFLPHFFVFNWGGVYACVCVCVCATPAVYIFEASVLRVAGLDVTEEKAATNA